MRHKSFKRKLREDCSVIFKGFTYIPENKDDIEESLIGTFLSFYYFGDDESFDLSVIYYQPDPMMPALKFI